MPASRGPIYYGGQAVIEGVMIRGPRGMAVAVRAPDGEIVVRSEQLSGIYAGRVRRIPFVRGIVVLYETLALGVRALTWSSQVASGRPSGEVSGAQMAVTLAVTLLLVGSIFFVGPVFLTGWIGRVAGNHFIELVAEGVLRLGMLVGYIYLIGRVRDIQRVFAYHGAEHRTIHAYEHGRALTPANVREYRNAHPRCGTAFLLTVAVLSLVVFVALGTPPLWVRAVERVVLIPVIASIAYELLRLGQRFEDNAVVAALYRPNLWLQSLTTRDPDDAQIEVAIAALNAALAVESTAADATSDRAAAEEPLA